MNKYEKLIEYIINENEQKARELFHEIVVEKSRDIYESIMDEEQMAEMGGDQQQGLVDEVTADENGGVVEDDDEFDLDGAGADDEITGDLPADDEGGFGDDEGMGDDSAPATKGDIADLESQLDDLKAMFADQEGDSDMDADDDLGAPSGEGEGGFGDEGPEEVGAGDDEPFGESVGSGSGSGSGMMEGEQPEWLKKKGSGSGSGKGSGSGSGAKGSGSGSGSGVKESKSVAQLMREYVDTIGQVYGGEGDNAEGTESGNGKKVPVNTKSISRTSGPDFGGTSKNILNKTGATNENPDGKQTPKPNNEYSKGEGKFSNEKFQNQAGGSKKQSAVGKNWESENGAEGQTTSGKVSVQDKTVLKQNTGK
jgi:hypothetical protein